MFYKFCDELLLLLLSSSEWWFLSLQGIWNAVPTSWNITLSIEHLLCLLKIIFWSLFKTQLKYHWFPEYLALPRPPCIENTLHLKHTNTYSLNTYQRLISTSLSFLYVLTHLIFTTVKWSREQYHLHYLWIMKLKLRDQGTRQGHPESRNLSENIMSPGSVTLEPMLWTSPLTCPVLAWASYTAYCYCWFASAHFTLSCTLSFLSITGTKSLAPNIFGDMYRIFSETYQGY